ncbi:transcription termination factor 1, mitochondrial-like [Pyxicephalus adspersus]|uniref:Uncharacterized protein n=1 Tax=Pyxicephalus adspersus TaxID=30357 RepID=A0AAV3AJL8_PYXAD|nr:TPA: hypothetical protein GDO54_012776 [Pyxicephalus adspersus]
MALKVLISTSSHFWSHLKCAGNKNFPKPELRNVVWKLLHTEQVSNYGVKAESENVAIANVDAAKTSKPQAAVRTKANHGDQVRMFLRKKGVLEETIDSVLSRYPRAIMRPSENLQATWEIWKSILKTDLQVLQTLVRSPESFFRSSDLENLNENISYLSSQGLPPKIVTQLMAKAPRTFSNRVTLNQAMVEFLQNLCSSFGGNNPQEFARTLISKKIYLLSRSTRRIQANIEMIQTILKIPDSEILDWIQSHGFGILDLGNTYITKNFDNMQKKLQSLGCLEEEIISSILEFPRVLYLSPGNFNTKIDLLLKYDIKVHQILKTPRVLEMSTATLQSRIEELLKHEYDFQTFGIGLLLVSKTRYKSRVEKFVNSKDKR